MSLVDEHGNAIDQPKAKKYYYSESPTADSEAMGILQNLLQLFKEQQEARGNHSINFANVKIQSYGKRPSDISLKIVSIEGHEIARLHYVHGTKSGNVGVQLTTALDIGTIN